jgi:hypothetical protein
MRSDLEYLVLYKREGKKFVYCAVAGRQFQCREMRLPLRGVGPGRPDAKNLALVVTTDASCSNVILLNLRGGLPEAYIHRLLHSVDGMHGSCLECFVFYSYLLLNSTALLS